MYKFNVNAEKTKLLCPQGQKHTTYCSVLNVTSGEFYTDRTGPLPWTMGAIPTAAPVAGSSSDTPALPAAKSRFVLSCAGDEPDPSIVYVSITPFAKAWKVRPPLRPMRRRDAVEARTCECVGALTTHACESRCRPQVGFNISSDGRSVEVCVQRTLPPAWREEAAPRRILAEVGPASWEHETAGDQFESSGPLVLPRALSRNPCTSDASPRWSHVQQDDDDEDGEYHYRRRLTHKQLDDNNDLEMCYVADHSFAEVRLRLAKKRPAAHVQGGKRPSPFGPASPVGARVMALALPDDAS